MLWTHPTPRRGRGRAVTLHSSGRGDSWPASLVVAARSPGVVVAAGGCAPRVAAAPRWRSAPAVFHLLFQERTRPLRAAAVSRRLLAAWPALAEARAAARRLPRRLGIAGVSLMAVRRRWRTPADGSPAFRAVQDAANRAARRQPSSACTRRVHRVRRARLWRRSCRARLPAPHGREWLAGRRVAEGPTAESGSSPIRAAPISRIDRSRARAGAPTAGRSTSRRSSAAPPRRRSTGTSCTAAGWMLDRGWALTAEIGRHRRSRRLGPHRRRASAGCAPADTAALMMIGGRHLGRRSAGRDHRRDRRRPVLDAGRCRPGFFLRARRPRRRAGRTGYAPLTVSPVQPAARVPGGDRAVRPPAAGRVHVRLRRGWYEPEYNPRRARSWRWMSERASLGPSGRRRDVIAPRRRVPAALFRRARRGAHQRRRPRGSPSSTPSADFTAEVTDPGDALEAPTAGSCYVGPTLRCGRERGHRRSAPAGAPDLFAERRGLPESRRGRLNSRLSFASASSELPSGMLTTRSAAASTASTPRARR